MHSTSPSHLLRQFIAAPRRCTRSSVHTAGRWASLAASGSSSTASRCSIPALNSSRLVHSRHERRTFVSTAASRAAVAQKPKTYHAELVTYPSPSAAREEDTEEDEDEPEVDYVPPQEAVLGITDRAAEVSMFHAHILAG